MNLFCLFRDVVNEYLTNKKKNLTLLSVAEKKTLTLLSVVEKKTLTLLSVAEEKPQQLSHPHLQQLESQNLNNSHTFSNFNH